MRIIRIVAFGYLLAAATVRSQAPSVPGGTAFWGARSKYADATANSSTIRTARNALFDGFSGEAPLSESSPPQLMTYPLSHSHGQLLPHSLTQAIITGNVTHSASYLSNDRTAIYSEFQVSVGSVVYNNSTAQLATGTSVDVLRGGGVILMPSGKVLLRGCQQESLPGPRRSFLLLLAYSPRASAFTLTTGFELSGSHVYALDSIMAVNKRLTLQDMGQAPAQFTQAVQNLFLAQSAY